MTSSANPRWQHDCAQIKPFAYLCGIDEAGRGALAGPVVAGALVLWSAFFESREAKRESAAIQDSKQLTAAARLAALAILESWTRAGLASWASGSASVEEISQHNILGATRLAMQRALLNLGVALPSTDATDLPLFANSASYQDPNGGCLLVDGRPLRPFPYAHQSLIKGDSRSLCIAGGSIIAKVTRDQTMEALEFDYPDYGFATHKGYGTRSHCQAIRDRGPCQAHRPLFLRKLGLPDPLSKEKVI